MGTIEWMRARPTISWTRAAALALVALAGCLDGAPGDGRVRCNHGGSPADACPHGFYCAADDRCYHYGVVPDLAVPAGPCPNEGAKCGPVPDMCHDAPTCQAGVCTPNPKPDTTVCADPMNPCKKPGVCTSGVCGSPTNQPDKTPCTTPTNPCLAPGECTAGACGSETVRADGFQYDTSDYKFRCCNGQPARLDQSPNCGGCGIMCTAGQGCTNAGASNNMQYWCTCTTPGQCWSNCCPGSPGICSPSSCGSTALCEGCPPGSTCVADMVTHYYCHY
jgi:hypothetical protein